MSAGTAAVVGVIANLALWVALHTLFPSGGGLAGLDLFAAGVAAVAGTGLVLLRWSVVPVVLASAAAGVVWHLVH